MIVRLAAASALLALAGAAGEGRSRPQEDKEPPLLLYLEVDGKKLPVEPDKPFDLETGAGRVRMTLRMEPYRLFPHGGIRFHYPREFSFEADLDTPGVAIWTLSGNNCVIMVHRHKGAADPKSTLKETVDALIVNFGRPNVKESETTIELQKTLLKGTKLEVKVAGSTIHQRLFSFASGKDSIVLILQDTPRDDGSPSADGKSAEKMLRETFKFPENR